MIHQVNPKQLLNSKWTAVNPENKEKHFLVAKVEFEKNGAVNHCQVLAIKTKRRFLIDWQALKDESQWRQGWL